MNTSRRGFLVGLGTIAGGGAGFLFRLVRAGESAPFLIRPPGALAEPDFLAACIRCGQCIQACPYDSLIHAEHDSGVATGTPWVDTRETPCFLCRDHDELLCIETCPSGALRPVEDLESIDMGLAVIDPELCLAFNGVVCRSCWHACPYPNAAIRFDSMLRPVVVEDACIGCGLCDQACLAEKTAIPVVPASEVASRRGAP